MNTCFIGSLNFGFMLNILKFLANMSVQPVRLLVTCAQYIYIFSASFKTCGFDAS